MSSSDVPVQPAFHSNEADGLDRPPLNRMAVVALVAGIISLIAPMAFALLPLSILAVALGAVVLWRVSREASRGAWLAQLGLALGVISGAWSISVTASETQRLMSLAGAYSKLYLDSLSHDKVYEALELRLPVRERQIAGTDLEAYYKQRSGEPADRTYEIVNSRASQIAIGAGDTADWQLSRGVEIQSRGSQKMITVEMINAATSNSHRLQVQLRREIYQDSSGSRAVWMIMDAYPVDASGNRI